MIAIPVAAFMGSFAMIVGPAPQTWCNHFGHGRPMIAIPTADDCGSLQLRISRSAVSKSPYVLILTHTIPISGVTCNLGKNRNRIIEGGDVAAVLSYSGV